MQIFVKTLTGAQENNWKTDAPSLITTSKRSQPYILYSVLEEACKFLSKHLQEKLLHWKSSLQILLKMSKQRSRTRKVFPRINSVSSLQESSWKMVALYLTTTSKKSQPFTLSFG